MKLIIAGGRFFLGILYSLMKLAPVRHRVCMLSRESDKPPLDFVLLEQELKKQDSSLEVVSVCEFIGTDNVNPVRLLKNTLRCMRVTATSSACVTDTYCLALSLFKQREGFTAVQVWHALGAVKKFGYQCLDTSSGRSSESARALSMHKNYSFVTCAGAATADIYSEAFGVPRNNVLILGMPRLDRLLEIASHGEKAEALSAQYPCMQGKKCILYAPTFRDDGALYLDEILNTVDFDRYCVIVKAHILTRDRYADDRLIITEDELFDLFAVADYVVTDYSAASFEAAAAGKKLLFYTYDVDSYRAQRGLNIVPGEEYPAISSESFARLYEIIEEDSYDNAQLEQFTSKYIQVPAGSSERIARELLERMGKRT